MAADVSLFAAFIAGLLSFLSPCVLPLVPPYLVYLAGTSLERLADAEPTPVVWRDTIVAAALFVAGFSTVFIAFGASASAIGALVLRFSPQLSILAGIAIIVMGLHFLGLAPIGLLMREKRLAMPKPVGIWGAYENRRWVVNSAVTFGAIHFYTQWFERLGAQPCQLVVGTKTARLYGAFVVNERHRHRYEFNNAYREKFEKAGFGFSGHTPDGKLVEIIEIPKHPFFIASQFHPEFHSKPHQPHPFFKGFIAAAHQRIHQKPL